MSWTNIPNANLAIGAPIRSIDQLALRDNPIAIAEGATGAPRVRAEALNGGQSGSAPIFAARAWVNFDGTGTVSIRGSGNVSSITDQGVGLYRVNLTTPMSDTNFSTLITGDNSAGNGGVTCGNNGLPTTTDIQIRCRLAGAQTAVDLDIISVSVFR
jgi:hypothetical protein